MLRQYPITGLVEGWYFRQQEVSAGCYVVEASDVYGRKISRQTIGNPEPAMTECVELARQMLTTSDIAWHRYSRLPASVRLHYIAPDGQHPLTPREVRQRYTSEVTDSSLVIWQHSLTQRFGFRAGIDELAWPLASIGGFELSFSRPAKGGGDIALWAQCGRSELVLSSDRFTPELLEWFRPIAAGLVKMFPDRVVEKDHGYDA